MKNESNSNNQNDDPAHVPITDLCSTPLVWFAVAPINRSNLKYTGTKSHTI